MVDRKATGIYLDNSQPIPTKHKDKVATRITSAWPLKGWEHRQIHFPSRFCRSVLIREREREFRRRFAYVVHTIDYAISYLFVMAVGDFFNARKA